MKLIAPEESTSLIKIKIQRSMDMFVLKEPMNFI